MDPIPIAELQNLKKELTDYMRTSRSDFFELHSKMNALLEEVSWLRRRLKKEKKKAKRKKKGVRAN